MIRKFAAADILEAQMGQDAGFAKSAHRAVFNYTPRAGYLYVRSRAISSRCNDNFDMFPAPEIEKSYQTFLWKPVFVNHHNEDHRRARGVIIDAALHKDVNPDGSPDTWAELLHEVDAIKFPRLAKAILKGDVNRTSMGCDVQFSKCSVCHNVATSPLEYCAHIPGKKGKRIYRVSESGQREGQLVFEICSGLSFFENSLLVEQPADPTAYFLGEVESGPGLESLKASIGKTANAQQAAQWIQTHDPEAYKKEYNAGWTRSRNVGQFPDRDITTPYEHGYYDNATDMEKWHAVHCTDPGYHDNCPTAKSFNKTASLLSERPTMHIWELIKEAVRINDDSLDPKTAGLDEANQYLQEHPIHPQHIVDRIKQAAQDPTLTHSGMNWYGDAHNLAKTMASHHNVPLHHVAGALGVYSASSAPAPNFHYASLALHNGRGVYSQPDKSTGEQKGYLGDNYDAHGAPMATHTDASKVDRILNGEHYEKVIKASKTKTYARLIENPENDHDVVVDRHAVAAAVGHKGSSGEPYSKIAPSIEAANKQGGGRIYDRVADAYRTATHHINNSDEFSDFRDHLKASGLSPDGTIRPHQAQALAWIVQKGISDQHNRSNPGAQRSVDAFQHHYTTRYGEHAFVPSNYKHFFGADPTQKQSRRVQAYGETKAPQDVDTLRSENCTVCGNSTAFDGKQCQVCGYVAPPKPFGDPNTDIARANDLRKQILDGDEADPMQNEEMGNQQGDPGELEEQQDDAESGLDQSMGMLTCNNCGTGVQPAAPLSEGGEPPYPADGDVCPVCKKGQLLSDSEEAPEDGDEDQDEDGVPDKDEDEDKDGIPDDEEDSDESDDDDDDKKKAPKN